VQGTRHQTFRTCAQTLAGDYTDTEYPPTLEAAVRSGVRAAQIAIGKEA